MAKQQYRWARGSQYNTLRMLPWMIGCAPVLAFFFVVDIVIPFLWICSAIGWLTRSFVGYHGDLYGGILNGHRPFELPAMLCLMLASSWVSMSLRQQRHLEQCPGDIFMMPVYVIFSTLFLLPIRLYGFIRMAKPAGWGTRENAFAGGEASSMNDGGAVLALTGASSATSESTAGSPIMTAGSPIMTDLGHTPIVQVDQAHGHRFNPYEIVPVSLFVLTLVGGVLYDTWPK